MRKYLLLFALLLLSPCLVNAQGLFTVKAKIISSLDSLPVYSGVCKVFNARQEKILEIPWKEDGLVSMYIGNPGKYVFQFQADGYVAKDYAKTILQSTDLGTIALKDNMVRLKVVTVEGKARFQIVKGDTTIYNPKAFAMTPDATLKDMVRQIPGMEIRAGELVWHGKTIDRILVNGQDFFGKDKSIALENLTYDAIDKVKVYDKQSEFTEKTGIEDGDKKTVMDVALKDSHKARFIGNLRAGGGTEEQYRLGGFVTRFTDRLRTSALAETSSQMPTMIDMGSGRLLGSGTQTGRNHNQQYAGEVVWNNGKPNNKAGALNLNTHVKYAVYDKYNESLRSEELFVPQTDAVFHLSQLKESEVWKELNAKVNLKWQMTDKVYGSMNLVFNNVWRDLESRKRMAAFRSTPYGGGTDVLDELWQENPEMMELAIHRNRQSSDASTDQNQMQFDATIIHNLKPGRRSLTWYGGFQRGVKDYSQYTLSDIVYYDTRSTEVNRQYIPQDEFRTWLNGTVRYTETLSKNLSLIAGYSYLHTYDKSDRPLFQLDSLGGDWAGADRPLWSLPEGDLLQTALNLRNSVYSKRYQQNHAVEFKLSYRGAKWTAVAGLVLRPEQTRLEYQRDRIDTSIVRNLFYPAPTLYLKRVIGNKFVLDANYSAVEKYPDLVNMLDYVDDTDPLNVSRGNPNLKPSWTHNGSVNFRYYNSANELSISNNLRLTASDQGMSSLLTYNPETGVRTITLQNVDGNYSLNYSGNANIRLDEKGWFHLSPYWSVGHQKYHNFIQLDAGRSVESATSVLRGGVSAQVAYQKGNTRFTLYGGWNGEDLQNNMDADFKEFHYTGNLGSVQMFELPWAIRVYSDLDLSWNRGYAHAPMNKMEYVWNVQLSRSFLKKNSLTLTLAGYDLLRGKQNNWYQVSDYSTVYSHYMYVNSYFMLEAKYIF